MVTSNGFDADNKFGNFTQTDFHLDMKHIKKFVLTIRIYLFVFIVLFKTRENISSYLSW